MWRFIALVLCCVLPFAAAAPCPCRPYTYDDLILNNCTTFVYGTGQMVITIANVTGITSLSAFAGIEWVSNDCAPLAITIDSNPDLVSLVGLESMKFLQWPVRISNNPRLSSLQGLGRIQQMYQYGSLVIANNTGMTSLRGLDTLAVMSDTACLIKISGNAALTSLDGFIPVIAVIAAITFSNNAALVSLAGSGLSRCTKISTVTVDSNPALVSMGGFILSATTLGQVFIINNPALASIATGFPSVLTIQQLHIDSNPFLTSLSGFDTLSASPQVTITNNARLQTLRGIQNIRSVASFTLQNNPSLRDFSALQGWPLPTDGTTVGGICCPPYTFFARAPTWNTVIFSPCIDCVSFGGISPAAVSVDGGVVSSLTYTGLLEQQSVRVWFTQPNGTSGNTTCSLPPVDNGALSCVLPAYTVGGEYSVSVQVDPSRAAVNTALRVVAVPFDEYAGGINLSVATTYGPSLESDSGDAAGVITTDAARVQYLDTWIVGGVAISLFALVSGAVFFCSCCGTEESRKYCRSKFQHFDVFYVADLDDERTPDGSVILYRRTPVGGVVVAVMILFGLALMSAYLISAIMDNAVTTQTYRPTRGTNPARSTYTATLVVGSFHGECEASGACSSELVFSETLTGGVEQTRCQARNRTLSYGVVVSDCLVSYTCSNCTLPAVPAVISLRSANPNSFALSVGWSITSVDHLGEPSTVSGQAVADTGYVLKGSAASAIGVTVVPSAYVLFDNAERKGVVLEWGAQSRGSQYTPQTLSESGTSGFGVQMELTTFGATLAITVSQRQSWPVIIAQILAIISGVVTLGKAVVVVVQRCCYSRPAKGYYSALRQVVTQRGLADDDGLRIDLHAASAADS